MGARKLLKNLVDDVRRLGEGLFKTSAVAVGVIGCSLKVIAVTR